MVLHAADDDHVYVEFVRLLNDFGEKQKTADSVPQVQWCFGLFVFIFVAHRFAKVRLGQTQHCLHLSVTSWYLMKTNAHRFILAVR